MFHKYKIENLIVIPRIVTIHYLELDKSFGYEGEKHDFWELVYADSEDVGILADDRQFVLKSGQITFHKPNEFHSLYSLGKPANVFIATFDCNSAAIQYFAHKVYRVPQSLHHIIADILNEARQTFVMAPDKPFITKMQKKDPPPPLGSLQLIRIGLESLLIRILREQNQTESSVFIPPSEYNEKLIAEIDRILENQIYTGFSLKKLCDNIAMGKSAIYTLYKSKTGKTPGDKYAELRLEEAKKLLRKTGRVSETADTLGFSSQGYFINFFKKHTGTTPKRYISGVVAAADSLQHPLLSN